MKLTAEDIAKIEDLIETCVEYGQRAAIIKYGLRDIHVIAGMISCLRALGVRVPAKSHRGSLSPEDRLAFKEWLATRKATL